MATSTDIKSNVFAGFLLDDTATILCPFAVANSEICFPILPLPNIAIFIRVNLQI